MLRERVLAARLPRRGDRRGRAPRRPLSSQLCGCGCVVRRARSRRGSQARCTGGCSASSRDFNKPPVSIARQSARHGGSMTRRSASRATGPMCIVLSNQHGQIVDAYVSERRNATAAQTFFEHAIDETGCTPVRVVTDKAKWYPPARREGAPLVEPRTSKYLNNGLERDHGHLKQRLQPVRGVGQAASATLLAWGMR